MFCFIHRAKRHAQIHTLLCNFPHPDAFAKHMAADSKNLARTLTESAFSLLAFPLYSLSHFFPVPNYGRHLVYLRKQEFPNLSHLLVFSSPAIIQNNKTLAFFFSGRKLNV